MQFGIESGLVHQLRQPFTVGQGRPGEDGHRRKPRDFCLEFRYRFAFSQGYRLLAGQRYAVAVNYSLDGGAGVGTAGTEGQRG
jgi:hypothetical protein